MLCVEWLLYWQRATCSGFPLDLCQVYLGEDQGVGEGVGQTQRKEGITKNKNENHGTSPLRWTTQGWRSGLHGNDIKKKKLYLRNKKEHTHFNFIWPIALTRRTQTKNEDVSINTGDDGVGGNHLRNDEPHLATLWWEGEAWCLHVNTYMRKKVKRYKKVVCIPESCLIVFVCFALWSQTWPFIFLSFL